MPSTTSTFDSSGGGTALVLSGGGVRGAYQVGVVGGIVDALGSYDRSLFQVFVGASVGAVNAAFLAAHASDRNLGADKLAQIWSSLALSQHLRFDVFGLGSPRAALKTLWKTVRRGKTITLGSSLLDAAPLEALVSKSIPWHQLHQNVRTGLINAVVIPAFNVATGRTTMFAELSEGTTFRRSRDPRRSTKPTELTASHLLASAAIPVLFPARRVDDSYYCDGGLRFNTPIAPAIRVGAERIVVICPIGSTDHSLEEHTALRRYPNLFFLGGKLLNALLADPVLYDLTVLERFNKLMDVLNQTLDPQEMERVKHVLDEARGMAYRKIDTLVFMPSRDIGRMAADYLRARIDHWDLSDAKRYILKTLAGPGSSREADWASYLLFDGPLAKQLIDLGYKDAMARKDEIRAFFRPKLEVVRGAG